MALVCDTPVQPCGPTHVHLVTHTAIHILQVVSLSLSLIHTHKNTHTHTDIPTQTCIRTHPEAQGQAAVLES